MSPRRFGSRARVALFLAGGGRCARDAPCARRRRASTAMGVTRRTEAGEPELDAGLAFLRLELRKLADAYPAQAERLRIPGSVEAVDERLETALVGDNRS